jgi:hypothetical protein
LDVIPKLRCSHFLFLPPFSITQAQQQKKRIKGYN